MLRTEALRVFVTVAECGNIKDAADRLFRTLGIREHADRYAAQMDMNTPGSKALQAYLDGVNQYQASRPAPLEFDVLGIEKRPFTPADTLSVAGYMAYSFAAAFRTEPVLTYVRDELGADYLKAFDLAWHPEGVLKPSLAANDWSDLNRIARLSQQALEDAGLPQFEGSNAWAVSGSRTASGKPLLAGDPHIRFAAPAVWYEAQLSYPGFELYGHHQALNPVASLGHNRDFGWSLTMFQNDDIDLVAEKVNPANADEVWSHGKWVKLAERSETIAVKGQAPVALRLRRSPHGPIINDALFGSVGPTPIAIKALFYFVLAPLAARRPPVRLLPDTGGVLTLETGASSVSRAMTVDSLHELLIHPEFLQSASVAGEKTTQWLLSWRFALTSLSAGMVALTRIRCDVPESFVISATHNALAEIGVLNVPAGSAVVMQPHNLVGVMQRRDTPLRITAHWRLTSLHAWLTLQLRYLAFHGPAQLIVQGCRGVRVERADQGRNIQQAATIGFNANLAYTTRRSDTFGAYLLGKQGLLNDSFGGASGFYVYEEMPHTLVRGGRVRRGLEGVADSLLKVFGI